MRISLLVFSGVAAGMALTWATDPEFLDLWALTLLLLAIGGIPLCLELSAKTFDIMNLRNAFVLTYLLEYAVWTAYILTTGTTQFFIADPRTLHDTFALALVYANLGLLCFHIGYYVPGSILKRASRLSGSWDRKAVNGVSLCLAIVGILAFVLLMRDLGGISAYISEWGHQRAIALRGKTSFAFASTNFLALSSCLLYVVAIRGQSRRHLGFAIITLLILTLAGLIIGYRNMVALPAMQLLVIHHYLRRPLTPNVTTVSLAVFLILCSNLYAWLRATPSFTSRPDLGAISDSIQDAAFWKNSLPLLLNRFHGIECLVIVIEKTSGNVPFELGIKSLTEIVTAPVPRIVWPDKPAPQGVRFSETFFFQSEPRIFSQSGGIAPGWLGEAYWNFHVAGVLFGSLFAGAVCKTLYRFFVFNRGNASVLLLYSACVPICVWLVEAPTLAIGILVLTWLPMLAVLIAVRGKVHAGARTSAAGSLCARY